MRQLVDDRAFSHLGQQLVRAHPLLQRLQKEFEILLTPEQFSMRCRSAIGGVLVMFANLSTGNQRHGREFIVGDHPLHLQVLPKDHWYDLVFNLHGCAAGALDNLLQLLDLLLGFRAVFLKRLPQFWMPRLLQHHVVGLQPCCSVFLSFAIQAV